MILEGVTVLNPVLECWVTECRIKHEICQKVTHV